jgi:hypothetical protein
MTRKACSRLAEIKVEKKVEWKARIVARPFIHSITEDVAYFVFCRISIRKDWRSPHLSSLLVHILTIEIAGFARLKSVFFPVNRKYVMLNALKKENQFKKNQNRYIFFFLNIINIIGRPYKIKM